MLFKLLFIDTKQHKLMKKNYTFKLLLVALIFSAKLFSQVNVTLKVDMSLETISSNGIHAVGSINGWSTTETELIQEGSTNIYSATIQLSTGWHEYKFLNGNAWGTEEQAGYPCAPSNGNRFLYINDSGNDVILETVPFNGCNAEGTGLSITLNVDMSSEAINGDGVHMAGSFNGWNPENFKFPNINDNIHSASLRLPTPSNYPITLEYKFLNGKGWGNEETPDTTCATVKSNNRIETIASSGQNIYNVFNGCNYTLSLKDKPLSDVEITYSKGEGLIVKSQKKYTKLFVSIYDLSGRKITASTIKNNENKIPLNSLRKDIYIIFINDENNHRLAKKILIQ